MRQGLAAGKSKTGDQWFKAPSEVNIIKHQVGSIPVYGKKNQFFLTYLS